MHSLCLTILFPGVLLLVAATSADDMAIRKVAAVRLTTASVTIIQAERVSPVSDRNAVEKRDRQIRKREKKPLIEFY